MRGHDTGSETTFSVTFHGVRGSTPCHGDDIMRYGGNTSCVSVLTPNSQPILFDLGTGLRYFGKECLTRDTKFVGTCLLTHSHFDHTQGLPFFAPLLNEETVLTVRGPVQDDGMSLQAVFDKLVSPPLFPVGLSHIPGTISFVDTPNSDFMIDDVHVKARAIPHVGATLGFRIELNGKSIAYLSDHQQPTDGSHGISDGARELVEGADLLIHDSQFTPQEFAVKSTWGHCTAEYAVWVATTHGVKNLALFHHDPSRSDDALDASAACLTAIGKAAGCNVFIASEGLNFHL
jgi:phosphoribosyl 1,2-cyclic phosphodiesterase